MSRYSYNEADTARFTAEKRHLQGAFARLITDCEIHDSENNDNVMVVISSKALSDPDDPNSIVAGTDLKTWATLPLANPDVDGHEAPDYAGSMWAQVASALFPEDCSALPGRTEVDAQGKLTGPLYFQGEEIDSDDFKQYEAQAVAEAGRKAPQVADDPSSLVGLGYFCHVKYKKDKEGRERVNQVAFRAELPDHWELETTTFIETLSVNGSEAAPAAKKAAKRGAKAKKATKKTTRRRRSA